MSCALYIPSPSPLPSLSLAASLLSPSANVSPARRLDLLCGIDEDGPAEVLGDGAKGDADGGGEGVIVRPAVVERRGLKPSVGVGRLWNADSEVERVAS